jgi:hypothetical protein
MDVRSRSGKHLLARLRFSGLGPSAKCAESDVGLPALYRFVSEFRMNMGRRIGEARIMSAQFRGTIAFALLALDLGVGPKAAFAIDCLAAPNSHAPPNAHWYYRTDRAQSRRCWHLQTDTDQSEHGAVQTAPEAPAKQAQSVAADNQYSLASFRDFLAQHGGTKLSDQDVDKLYAEFLEWKRRNN